MMSKLEALAKESRKPEKEVKATYQKHYKLLSKMYPFTSTEWRREHAYNGTEMIYTRRKNVSYP